MDICQSSQKGILSSGLLRLTACDIGSSTALLRISSVPTTLKVASRLEMLRRLVSEPISQAFIQGARFEFLKWKDTS